MTPEEYKQKRFEQMMEMLALSVCTAILRSVPEYQWDIPLALKAAKLIVRDAKSSAEAGNY